MATNPAGPVPPPKVHGQSTWDPTAAPPMGSGTPAGTNPTVPPVPQSSGSGAKTVVNTAALSTFADNIGMLVEPVTKAQAAVAAVQPVAAGAFDRAWTISGSVTGGGQSKGTPMVTSFGQVLEDLGNGLKDLQAAARKMVATYTTADALNNANVSDLQRILDDPAGDFNSLAGSSGSG